MEQKTHDVIEVSYLPTVELPWQWLEYNSGPRRCKQRHVNPKKESKLNAKIKNPITEIKNAFDGLINRLDMANKRISKFEDVSIESTQIEKQRGKME